MKNFLVNNAFVEIWKEAESPLDYLVAFWISGLAAIAVSGWFTLVIRWIMDPSMFDNVTFGVFDYI